MLFLDGVYLDSPHGSRPRFRWVRASSSEELTQLTHTITQRVAAPHTHSKYPLAISSAVAHNRAAIDSSKM